MRRLQAFRTRRQKRVVRTISERENAREALGWRQTGVYSQAPIYPAAGRAITNSAARSERAFSYAIFITGALLGSAIAAPLVSYLMWVQNGGPLYPGDLNDICCGSGATG